MNIGIACFPTVGGSGAVAAELARALADRGHRVHMVASRRPFRFAQQAENLFFHPVQDFPYPLFEHPLYTPAMASVLARLVQEASLDLLHVHYAVPHAIAGYLAKQTCSRRVALVTTLHGTDTLLVGLEPSLRPITRFSLVHSDGLTAVSHHLARATSQAFCLDREIAVIHNFVNPERFSGSALLPCLRRRFAQPWEKVVVHISNLRRPKRVGETVRAFALVAGKVPARLLVVGEGPERALAQGLARELGVGERVDFLGEVMEVEEILALADLLLLSSEMESFGLVALEAMACQVPVVAYGVGGLPEVVEHGRTGLLADPGNLDQLAGFALTLLQDPSLARKMGEAGRERALAQFSPQEKVAEYEAFYQRVMEGLG